MIGYPTKSQKPANRTREKRIPARRRNCWSFPGLLTGHRRRLILQPRLHVRFRPLWVSGVGGMTEPTHGAAQWLPAARAGSREALGKVLEACRRYLHSIA